MKKRDFDRMWRQLVTYNLSIASCSAEIKHRLRLQLSDQSSTGHVLLTNKKQYEAIYERQHSNNRIVPNLPNNPVSSTIPAPKSKTTDVDVNGAPKKKAKLTQSLEKQPVNNQRVLRGHQKQQVNTHSLVFGTKSELTVPLNRRALRGHNSGLKKKNGSDSSSTTTSTIDDNLPLIEWAKLKNRRMTVDSISPVQSKRSTKSVVFDSATKSPRIQTRMMTRRQSSYNPRTELMEEENASDIVQKVGRRKRGRRPKRSYSISEASSEAIKKPTPIVEPLDLTITYIEPSQQSEPSPIIDLPLDLSHCNQAHQQHEHIDLVDDSNQLYSDLPILDDINPIDISSDIVISNIDLNEKTNDDILNETNQSEDVSNLVDILQSPTKIKNTDTAETEANEIFDNYFDFKIQTTTNSNLYLPNDTEQMRDDDLEPALVEKSSADIQIMMSTMEIGGDIESIQNTQSSIVRNSDDTPVREYLSNEITSPISTQMNDEIEFALAEIFSVDIERTTPLTANIDDPEPYNSGTDIPDETLLALALKPVKPAVSNIEKQNSQTSIESNIDTITEDEPMLEGGRNTSDNHSLPTVDTDKSNTKQKSCSKGTVRYDSKAEQVGYVTTMKNPHISIPSKSILELENEIDVVLDFDPDDNEQDADILSINTSCSGFDDDDNDIVANDKTYTKALESHANIKQQISLGTNVETKQHNEPIIGIDSKEPNVTRNLRIKLKRFDSGSNAKIFSNDINVRNVTSKNKKNDANEPIAAETTKKLNNFKIPKISQNINKITTIAPISNASVTTLETETITRTISCSKETEISVPVVRGLPNALSTSAKYSTPTTMATKIATKTASNEHVTKPAIIKPINKLATIKPVTNQLATTTSAVILPNEKIINANNLRAIICNSSSVEIFGITCYRYLGDDCEFENSCSLSHRFHENSVVQNRLTSLSREELQRAHYFTCRHSMIFERFFWMFIQIYVMRKESVNLIASVDDCVHYDYKNGTQYLHHIYAGLKTCGFDGPSACKAIVERIPLHNRITEIAKHNMIDIIMKSDWTKFVTKLDEIRLSHHIFSLEALTHMARTVLNNFDREDLNFCLFRCLKTMIDVDVFSAQLRQVPEIMEFLSRSEKKISKHLLLVGTNV